MTEQKEKFITVRANKKLLKQLKESAKEMGMSFSEYVRFVLTTYELEKRKPKKDE